MSISLILTVVTSAPSLSTVASSHSSNSSSMRCVMYTNVTPSPCSLRTMPKICSFSCSVREEVGSSMIISLDL